MKKNVTLSLLAALWCFGAVAFSGCKSDEAPLSPEEAQVTFVLGGVTTRTVTESDFTTKFVAADEIGIYASGVADGDNEKFTVADEGTLYSETNIYYTSSSGTANFYAYYPYCEQTDDDPIVLFNVPSDQSTEAQFNKADFMTAVTTDVAAGTQNIELKFRHQMTLIQVGVSKDRSVPVPDGIDLQAFTGLEWSYLEGSYYTYNGDFSNVKMWKRSDDADSYTFWALVPPQTIAPRTKFLTINCGSDSYAFTTKGSIDLTGNTVKKFNIKIADDGSLVVFSNDILCGEWDQDGSVIEGEGTLVIPNTLMELEDFEYFSAKEITKNKEQIDGAGWWRAQFNEKDVVEVIDEEEAFADRGKVMHIKRDTITGWHNGTYYYCVENVNRIAGNYQLSFKARSSESADMKGNQLRIGAYMQEPVYNEETGKTTYKDYFPMIINYKGEEVTTVFTQVLTSDSYQTYTVNFNVSKVSTVNNGTADKVTEESKSDATDQMLTKLVLYISCNAKRVDFWIDDISWKPEKQ